MDTVDGGEHKLVGTKVEQNGVAVGKIFWSAPGRKRLATFLEHETEVRLKFSPNLPVKFRC